jgi:hypothetical protein
LPRVLQRTLKRHRDWGRHRDEEGDEVDELVTGLAAMVLHPLRTSAMALARISEHTALYIGEGNRVVFKELAGSFADFIEIFGDRDLSEHRLVALLAKYRDGPAEPDDIRIDHATELPVSDPRGGQGHLKDMLSTLHRAALTPDPGEKAQLMLLASAYGGLHEQKRLQSYIEKSLGTVIDDVFIRELRYDTPIDHEAHGFFNRMILRVGRRVAKYGRRKCAEWSSKQMMTMPLPDETIRLGQDIRAEKGGPLFPPALEKLSEPELVELIEHYCPDWSKSPNVFRRMSAFIRRTSAERPIVVGVAATNWGEYDQRMRLILAYFRTRQQCQALHDCPFTAEQVAALVAGDMPTGKL